MPARRRSKTRSASIRVALVDDHPLWRDTLRRLLELDGFATVVSESGDGREAVEQLTLVDVDVVLMDINLPSVDGIAATEELLGKDPDRKILVLASSDERSQVINAISAGASGYLLKTAAPEEVIDAVSRIFKGELVFPSSVAPVILGELRGRGRRRGKEGSSALALDPSEIRGLMDDPKAPGSLSELSAREKEVLTLMAEGLSNQSIAERLFLGAKTVEVHVRNIFMKLGLEPDSDVNRRVLAVVAYLRSVQR